MKGFSEGLLDEGMPSLAWHLFSEEQEAYDVRQREHNLKLQWSCAPPKQRRL